MRVGVVTQYYPPEEAAGYYPAAIAARLVQRGHSVRVVTGYPNYPSGRIFPGYRQRWRMIERSVDRVEVLRVPLFIDHSKNGLLRMVSYLSFGVSSAIASRRLRDADVVYVYATQMTPAIGPWLQSFFGGAPYVLHIQDLWPDSITGSSMVSNPLMKRMVETLLLPWLNSVYRRASAVVAIAPTMVETLAERGVERTKLHLLYNWGPNLPGGIWRADAREGQRGHRTRLLYAGNVGDMQDLETVIRAAASVQDLPVDISIVGDGVALGRVKALAHQLGANNVLFKGRVPLEETARYYNDADYSLVTLKDLPAFRGTVPSKFQASLAHGVPVITTVQGDLRRLVERRGLGFAAEAECADSLASAIRAAVRCSGAEREAMVRAAKEAYAESFSWAAGTETMESILLKACRFQEIC